MNQIDLAPAQDGWGMIWQGSEADRLMCEVPKPFAFVSLIGEVALAPNLSCYLIDSDEETLSDPLLMAMVAGVIGFLSNGHNVLIHCFEGKYRSTYLDIAVHIRLGMGYTQAFSLITERHPIAEIRNGTSRQLLRLEGQLKG